MGEKMKIVRDNIQNIMIAQQKGGSFIVVDDDEAIRLLTFKLNEETKELINSNYALEELIDLQEVLNALVEKLCKKLNVAPEYLESLRKRKAETNGVFKENLVLL